MKRYFLSLLGPFEIRPAQQLTINRKTRAILAYLATTRESHTRRALAELFCQTTKDPAGSLRWHLSRIRREFDEDIPGGRSRYGRSPKSTAANANISLLWPNPPEATSVAEIRDNLMTAAGGNPLFITEILRELTQTAVLPTPLPVPPSLQELTNHRLNQLPTSSRQVIEALAMLEQPSPFDQVQQISGRTEDEAIVAIELGLRWRFLESRQANRYGFSHDLIGGAVRHQLSPIRRQRLHYRVADALTQRGADAAILAHHWGMAGHQEQQANFALEAGQQALRRAAFGDAIHLFQTALDALPTTKHQSRFQATLGIVQALEATGDVAKLSEELAVLADLAEQTGKPTHQAEAAQQQAKFFLLQGELEKVAALATQGLEWAATAQVTSLQASLWEILGKMCRDQGDYDKAYTYAEQALALYQDDNNPQGEIAILNLLGNLNIHFGQHQQAVEMHQQALALCRQLTDPFSESRILAWLADALLYAGDYGEAQLIAENGLAVSQEIGDKASEAIQLNNLAGLAIYRQDSKEAIVYYRQAVAIVESMNDPRRMAIYYGNMGGAYIGLGDFDAALSSLDKVIATAQKAGLPRQEAHAHHTQGYTYQRKNDYVAARAAFEKALSLRQELGEQFRSFLTLTQLVEVCIRLADWPTAETHLLAAQQLYDTLQHDMPPYAHEMFHYAAFLYHKEQGDDSDTTKHLKQAYHALQTQLAEMDSAGREQMLNNPAAQTILSTMSDLNKDE